MSDLRDFIAGMPKCELHVHLEGTLEPEMKFELAKRNGMTLPYKDAAGHAGGLRFQRPAFLSQDLL
jgi:adenosine deaminase